MARQYRNKGIGTGGTEAIAAGRIGRDGKRTFHIDFRGVKMNSGTSAGGAIDYIAAAGDYEGRDDLECRAGNVDMVRAACSEIEAGARVKRGPTAERVLVKMVAELPFELDRAQRAEVADGLVKHWAKSGHLAVAAVHHIEGKVNPHVHLAIAARPIMVKDKQLAINRDTAKRLMVGKAAVRLARAEVAELINNVAGRSLFHSGTLREIGIDRDGKRRVPIAVYKAGQHNIDLAAVDAARQRKKEENALHAVERERRETEKAMRRKKQADRNPFYQSALRRVQSERRHKRQIAKMAMDKARELSELKAHGEKLSAVPNPVQLQLVTDAHMSLGIELPERWWESPKSDKAAWETTRKYLETPKGVQGVSGRDLGHLMAKAARIAGFDKRLVKILEAQNRITPEICQQLSHELDQVASPGYRTTPLPLEIQSRWNVDAQGQTLTRRSRSRGGIGD